MQTNSESGITRTPILPNSGITRTPILPNSGITRTPVLAAFMELGVAAEELDFMGKSVGEQQARRQRYHVSVCDFISMTCRLTAFAYVCALFEESEYHVPEATVEISY